MRFETTQFNCNTNEYNVRLVHREIAKEAVVQRCSVKKVFLKISQNSLENTCAGFSFLIKLQGEG